MGTMVIGNMTGVKYIQIIIIYARRFFVSRNPTINAPNNNPTPDEKKIVISKSSGRRKYRVVIGK